LEETRVWRRDNERLAAVSPPRDNERLAAAL